MADIKTLIQTGAQLKSELCELQTKLKDINQQIFEQTAFVNGKNTVTTKSGNITAKIQRKETYSWDQDKLDIARKVIGDRKFLEIFSFKWEASKKKIDGFLENAPEEQKKPVVDALTIKPSFSIIYEEESDV